MTSPERDAKQGTPRYVAIAPRVAELVAKGWSRRSIATELQCAPSTVGRAAALVGATFDTSATDAATRARIAQAKAARFDLAALSFDLALAAGRRARRMVDDPEIDASTFRALTTGYGIATDKAAQLARLDAGDHESDELETSKDALAELVGAIFESAPITDPVACTPPDTTTPNEENA